MLKLVLFIAALAAVYFFFFKKKALNSPSNDNSQEEAMIPCAKCGIYVQIKEALMRDGKYYCSRECMEA